MRIRRLIFLLVFNLVISGAAFPQDKDPDRNEVIRVETQLVDVPVSAIGADGRPLRDLKKVNFAVYEDGKAQAIESFSTTAAPFEVALVLDTSGSTRSDIQLIKQAAAGFVGSLRQGDRVSISAYNSEIRNGQTAAFSEVLSPLTSDRSSLRAAIDRASTSFGTPYYDSLVDVADRVFREAAKDEFRGRRALVALTDGVDSTSSAEFEEVRERLAKAGVICFLIKVNTRDFFETRLLGDCQTSMRFSPAQIRRYYRGMSKDSRTGMTMDFCQLGDFERLAISKRLYEIADEEMAALAKMSGGRVFAVSDLTEAKRAFKEVADEIGTQFTLGYYSSNEKRDGTYRKIRVELKGVAPGTKVRTREGYTAPAN
jgi:Ca-activated chloride channel family protein